MPAVILVLRYIFYKLTSKLTAKLMFCLRGDGRSPRFCSSLRSHCGSPRVCSSYGFSLLELLLAIALMAILSAIAWPQYQQYITRAKRQQAERCLLVMSSAAEQQAQMQDDYSGITKQSLRAACGSDSVLSTNYKFVWQGQDEHYLLQAIPQQQQAAHDQACAVLQLDDRGRRTVSGAKPAEDCWH